MFTFLWLGFYFQTIKEGREVRGEWKRGGREEKRMGGRGDTPVKWSVHVCKEFSRVDTWREGSSPASTRVFVDYLTSSQSSQVTWLPLSIPLDHIVPTI